MSENRQRLRPWLEAQINGNQVPGLQWLDDERTLFSIPWKHGGKPDWTEKDSVIFRLWAEHTGRYRHGLDAQDYATWKTRLRCAFNKAPDIQEEKDLSRPDADVPYRVYRLRPKSEVKKKRVSSSSLNASDSDSTSSEDLGTWTQPTQFSVPTFVSNMKIDTLTPIMSMEEELEEIKTDDLVKCDLLDQQKYISGGVADPMTDHVQQGGVIEMTTWTPAVVSIVNDPDMNLAPQSEDSQNTDIEAMDTLSVPMTESHQQTVTSQQNVIAQPEGHEMLVKLFYRTTQVDQYELDNPNGCRLFYNSANPGSAQNMAEIAQNFASQMGEQVDQLFGPTAVSQYSMPACQCVEESKQKELTNKLLESMERGLLLKCIDGDIYATRLCRCVIYGSSPHIEEEIFKLERDNTDVKVFDFNGRFIPAVERYLNRQGPRPEIEIQLGFGQKWHKENWSQREILISGSVVSAKALYIMQQVDLQASNLQSIQISGSDDFDKIVDTIKALCNLNTTRTAAAVQASA